MYGTKNPSGNKPNLIIPTRLDKFYNYLWVGTIQTVNICFLIKCVLLFVVVVSVLMAVR